MILSQPQHISNLSILRDDFETLGMEEETRELKAE